MRDIKFRVFEKDFGMCYVNEQSDYTLEFGNDNAILNIFCSDGKMDSFIAKNVMQFTALLDKNGKEIYEGDVLIYHNGLFLGDDGRKSIVEWFESGRSLTFFGCYGEFKPKQHEIIGNIYENPDLLNKIKKETEDLK